MNSIKTGNMKLYFLLVIALIASVLFVLFFRYTPGWDFRNNLWAPAYLLSHQQSPYHIQVLFDNSTAIWLPMSIGLLFPLGLLPLQQAYNLWLLLNIVALFFIVYYSFHSGRKISVFLGIILLMILFRPTLGLLDLGQFSLIACFLFLVIIQFDDKLHPFIIGVLLAVALTKPQLAMFFIPSYSILYAKEKGVKNLLLLWLYIGTGMLITSLPVWILHPAWLPDFIANLQQNPDWMQPNLYALFSQYLRNFQTPVMVIFFISGMAINLLLPFWLPKKPALLWSLALTTIFSLYLWSWDFVLLYPLFIHFHHTAINFPELFFSLAGVSV